MKVSLAWIKELIQLPSSVSTQELAKRLTLSGLEVESITEMGADKYLQEAVVVEVRGKRPHPQADKLHLVDVFDGQSVTPVVCGASNVPTPESKTQVVWAKPGTMLPSGIVLGAKEVRGVVSPGMLCAPSELGLAEQADGLLLLHSDDGFQTGQNFSKIAGLSDQILEINVTPNRPDCLGHMGIARELVALFWDQGARFLPQKRNLEAFRGNFTTESLVSVEVSAEKDCPRYRAVLVQDVRIQESPFRQRLRLERLGLRPINNVVDATQLSMLEWGQPLHAFDWDQVNQVGQRIQVRKAKAGEFVETLDGAIRNLEPEDVVIANAAGPIALAGIMGGKHSQVNAKTKNIFLESAYFDPACIRKTAKRIKLHTDASHRFERGVDPNHGLVQAEESCLQMMLATAGGRLAQSTIDLYPHKIAPMMILFSPRRIEEVLGIDIPFEQQNSLLTHLGFTVKTSDQFAQQLTKKDQKNIEAKSSSETGEIWQVLVPTFRPDLLTEIDLVEEIGRLWGYDKIKETLPKMSMPLENPSASLELQKYQAAEHIRDLCVSLGYVEIQTLPFTSKKRLGILGFQDHRAHPLSLQNPLREEASVLRTHLGLGMLDAVKHNHSHGQKKIRLFEVAEVFFPALSEAPKEQTRLSLVLSGARDSFMKEVQEVDFYDLKGTAETLIHAMYGSSVEVRPAGKGELSWLHPGVSAKLVWKDHSSPKIVGEMGEVHPDVRKQLGIEIPVFALEIDIPSCLPKAPFFTAWARFPAVERDLSFFVAEEIPVGDILNILYQAKESLLLDAKVLEDYREPGRVPTGKKGLLLSLRYRSLDRTLRDEEVQSAHVKVVHHLGQHLSIELR